MQKSKITFASLLLIFIIQLTAFSQCNIANLNVKNTACYAQGRFSVILDFDHNRPATATFRVQGNGTNYGTFTYDQLPITLTNLNGNCITNWEFLVRDNDTPVCSDYFVLGPVCCQQNCNFEVVNFETGLCISDNTFSAKFNLANTGNSNNLYDFIVNGKLVQSFESANQPIVIENIPSEDEFFEDFKICLNQRPDCCKSFKFPSPCFCSISNIRTRIENCDQEEQTYFVKLDFDFQKTTDSFYFGGEMGFLGTFAYTDLPITIGPIAFNETNLNVLFADVNNFFCFQEVVLPFADTCMTDCVLENLRLTQTDCGADNEFYFNLEFDAINPELNGFDVIVNDTIIFESLYKEGRYFVGPLSGDCITDYHIIIRDKILESCQLEGMLERVCCGACRFSNLTPEIICLDEKPSELIIDFDVLLPKSDSFFLNIDSNIFGPYAYHERPFSVDLRNLQISGESLYMLIYDSKSPDCAIESNITNPCGQSKCELTITSAAIENCDQFGVFDLSFTLLRSNTGNSFQVNINGENPRIFDYEGDDYIIENLNSDCGLLSIVIEDIDNPGCQLTYELDNFCCEKCELIKPRGAIICLDTVPEAVGLVVYTDPKLNEDLSFNLIINNVDYGVFQTFQSPIFLTGFSSSQNSISITTIPVDFPDCVENSSVSINCSACNNLILHDVFCIDQIAHISLDFQAGASFPIYITAFINGSIVVPFDLANLPLIINTSDFEEIIEYIHIATYLNEQTFCNQIINLDLPDCTNSTKDIFSDLIVQININNIYISSGQSETSFGVSVYDVLGRQLIKINEQSLNQNVDITSLPAGLYLLNLYGKAKSKTIKFVKF